MASNRGKLISAQSVIFVLSCFIVMLLLNCWRTSTANSDLMEKVATLEKIIQSSDYKFQQMERERIANAEKFNQCNNELSSLHLTVADKDSRIVELTKNVDAVKEEREDDIKKEESLRSECLKKANDIELKFKSSQAKLAETSSQLEAANGRIATLMESLDRARNESRSSACNSELAHLQTELDKCLVKSSGRPITQKSSDRTVSRGQLPLLLQGGAVNVQQTGTRGMKYHNSPIIVLDPPDSPRPSPRVSVANVPPAAIHSAAKEDLNNDPRMH